MMYDEKFLKSFVERVEATYLGISKITKYDTTSLLTSLTGILSVIDDEARQNIFSDIEIPKYIKATGESSTSSFGIDKEKDNDKANLAVIRHFRNSLCHFKINDEYIIANKKHKIKQILFEDVNPWTKKINFRCILTVKEIEKFMLFLMETIKGS